MSTESITTPEDVWVSIQSRPHGSSGRGISYYRSWAGPCAKRSKLSHEVAEQGLEAEAPTDSRGFHYFDVGAYYHMLHEIAIRGQLPNEAWDVSDSLDVDFAEAMRLYHGWRARFESVEKKYGGVAISTEYALPSSPVADQVVSQTLEGPLTGRVDLVMRIEDPEAVQRNTATEHSPGLRVTPGIYLIDFKTAKTFSDRDYFRYTHDLQARAYLTLYNLENPKAPARGMIFDQIVKHANLTAHPQRDSKGKVKQHSSFHAYLQMVDSEDIPVLRALVRNGLSNMAAPRANPDACIGYFDTCPHLLNGACRGH